MPKRTGGNGEHVVTMREVAKAAGVSIKTVSNVVNDYEFVSQATRDKVNKAIAELGYTVNVSARNLRRGQTGIIGLAIPDLQMPYFAQLSSLVIEEAKKVGLRVIVEPTQYSRDGELEALHGSQQTMIDGLIYSPLELGQDDVEQLKVDCPLVLVGERIFTDQVDHIATENVEGAKRATQYLLTTGCRRVAVVGVHPGEKVGSAALRYQGYLGALEEAGVEFDDRLVVESGMWHRSDGVEGHERVVGFRRRSRWRRRAERHAGFRRDARDSDARLAHSRRHLRGWFRQFRRFTVPVAGADVDRAGT